MKIFYVIIPVVLIFILFTGCETKVNQDAGNLQNTAKDSVIVMNDTVKINENTPVPADSFKVDESVYGLKEHISWLKELWSDVKNPLIVTYTGSEWGDYFHMHFKDAEGRVYDFGDGSNNFENVGVNGDELPDNFIGIKFKIYWSWKLSSFSCCEGMMNSATAKVPSIVKIEQLEK